ncbi:MAG: alpha/beta hydrolase [Henriciella sp.]|nr:alpha/beta hydrolase [Henriciella sp.]
MVFRTLGAASLLVFAAAMGHAEEPLTAPLPFVRVDTPEDAAAIPLYEGDAPGSEGSALEEVWRNAGTERWANNVTRPTLLPVLPDDPDATRAAVIVVPGGGFQFISMDNEGYPIAEWLAARGVAAFVLKYRTMETPADQAGYVAHMNSLWNPQPGDTPIDVTQGIPFAVADAQTALTLVRENAEVWGYDADKIGMLGFSAGAMTTIGVTLNDDETAPKPDYIGYIYGPMAGIDVPTDMTLPPMFNALAADDELFRGQGFGLVEAWEATGTPVEFHYYQSGGHGFGSYQRGVPADHWFDQFISWMAAQDLLQPAEAD